MVINILVTLSPKVAINHTVYIRPQRIFNALHPRRYFEAYWPTYGNICADDSCARQLHNIHDAFPLAIGEINNEGMYKGLG